MTGVELIAKERQEQIEKHKWDDGGDTWYLPDLAKFAIMQDNDAEKDNLREVLAENGVGPVSMDKIIAKNEKERLIVAGALLAAEIDRLQKLENT